MKKSHLLIFLPVVAIPLFFIVMSNKNKDNQLNAEYVAPFKEQNRQPSEKEKEEAKNAVAITEDGKQVINMRAKGGFWPQQIQAKSGLETTLKMTTQNTFDCSAALNIPKLGYYKLMPSTGTTEIAVPAQKPGDVIDGTCGMGMYFFRISFT